MERPILPYSEGTYDSEALVTYWYISDCIVDSLDN